MTDARVKVLVKFPADLLADLDAEARVTGRPRMEVIIDRCRHPPAAPAKTPGVRVDRLPASTKARAGASGAEGYKVQVGPVAPPPGSRLKQTAATKAKR